MITKLFQKNKKKYMNKQLLLLALDGLVNHKDYDQRASDRTLALDCLLDMGVVTGDDVTEYIVIKHSPEII